MNSVTETIGERIGVLVVRAYVWGLAPEIGKVWGEVRYEFPTYPELQCDIRAPLQSAVGWYRYYTRKT